jgi:hypothetical protein
MMRRAILACVLWLQGCSLLFVHGPPEGHEKLRYFDCPSNAAAPATGGFFGATYGLGAVVLAASHDQNKGTGVAIAGSLGAAFLASMAYGIVNTSACSDAKERLRQRLSDTDLATSRKLAELQQKLERQVSENSSSSPAPCNPAPQSTVDPAPVQELTPPAPDAPQ